MPFRAIYLSIVVCMLVLSCPTAWAKEAEPRDGGISIAQKHISTIGKVMHGLYKKVLEAKEEKNLHKLNCLLNKLNLVKGLLKVSERAKVVLMDAFYGGEMTVAATYRTKISSYVDAALDIEKSIDECSGVKATGEGTTLVYIRPEGEPEVEVVATSPWDWSYVPGAEGYPVVPPASPFR